MTIVILACFIALTVGAYQNPQKEEQRPEAPKVSRPTADEPVAITERSRSEINTEPVVLKSDQFGNFRFPVINDKGDIAFLAIFPGGNEKQVFSQAIFIRKADGSWDIVREWENPKGVDHVIHGFSMPAFNNNGDLTFMANFGDETDKPRQVLDSNDPLASQSAFKKQGLYLRTPDGVKQLLKYGEEVPLMPSVFSGISSPSTNNKGITMFIGTYTDPDGRGLFFIENGKLRLIARSGQRISKDDESTFSEHYYPTPINDRNEVAFLARIGDKSGIFVTRPGGIEKIAFIGDPSPIKGANYLGFGNRTPSLNNKGEVAFAGFYDGPDAGRALFLKGSGPVQVVAKSGDSIQGTTYNFTDFLSPAINSRGDIVFIGHYGGRTRGIFVKTAKGIEPVALSEERIPGGEKDDVFNNFTPPSINDRGEIVFNAQWKSPKTGVSISIFHRNEKGVLSVLVKRGDKIPEVK